MRRTRTPLWRPRVYLLAPEGFLEPAPTGRTYSVLIVDDVAAQRRLLRYCLQALPQFEVIGEAGDGKDAIAFVRERKPDLVLLDLSMPIMDGLEALPRIRYASPGTRIMVLTGFDEGRLGDVARRLGAMAYLEKGAPPEEILLRLVVVADNMKPAASFGRG